MQAHKRINIQHRRESNTNTLTVEFLRNIFLITFWYTFPCYPKSPLKRCSILQSKKKRVEKHVFYIITTNSKHCQQIEKSISQDLASSPNLGEGFL